MFDVKPITSPVEVDCGPTCLQMLLDFYGISAELPKLNKQCNLTVCGCTACDLKRVAADYGIQLRAYSMSCEELLRQDRPAIIHWRGNHFVVFCGMNDRGKVVICNPDRGRFPLEVQSFETMYTGTAIFNGEPHDLPKEVSAEERITELEKQNEMLTACILELSELLYN